MFDYEQSRRSFLRPIPVALIGERKGLRFGPQSFREGSWDLVDRSTSLIKNTIHEITLNVESSGNDRQFVSSCLEGAAA